MSADRLPDHNHRFVVDVSTADDSRDAAAPRDAAIIDLPSHVTPTLDAARSGWEALAAAVLGEPIRSEPAERLAPVIELDRFRRARD